MTRKNLHKLKPPDQICVMTGLKPAIIQARALNSKEKITVTRFRRYFGFRLALHEIYIYMHLHIVPVFLALFC